MSAPDRSIAERLAEVRAEIEAAAKAAGRASDAVTLVAVSKSKPEADVREAVAAGQRVFGENRVQEARGKFEALRREQPDLELHLIGPLQTNKAPDAVRLFDVIQSLDRPKLAEALAAALGREEARLRGLFVQVNTGEEPQKAGVLPLEADRFIADCMERLRLPVCGLMCVPPVDDEPSLHFALLRTIARRHGLGQLSMGMSGDFRIAIEQGATHVRVGTAIFGERQLSVE